MKLPFNGEELASNDLGFLTYTAAIALFVTKCVGGSILSWPLTLVLITGCILLPSFLTWSLESYKEWKNPAKEPESTNPAPGGDLRVFAGSGVNGGPPGRILLMRKQASIQRPFLVLFDEQTGGQFNVYMGGQEPHGELDAPLNSVYIQHFRKGPPPTLWWKTGEGAHEWEFLLGHQPN